MQISDVLVVVAFVIAQGRNCLFSERSKYLKAVFVRHSMPEICVIPQCFLPGQNSMQIAKHLKGSAASFEGKQR